VLRNKPTAIAMSSVPELLAHTYYSYYSAGRVTTLPACRIPYQTRAQLLLCSIRVWRIRRV